MSTSTPVTPPSWTYGSILRAKVARVLAAGSVAYTLVLVFLTHYPRPQELLGDDLPPDKMLHFLAYGTLGLLVTGTVVTFFRWSWRTVALTAVALAIFAGMDELTQPWFGRSAEPLDWVWDAIGLVAGIATIACGRWLVRSPLARSLQPVSRQAQ
jgi:VanZ family protein